MRDVVVTVFLRGGADGLSLVPPHGDSNYYNLRPTQAVPHPSSGHSQKAVDLNGFFGLSAAMSPLKGAYDDQNLAIIHAVGAENWSRSHFDAMKWMETSSRELAVNTGWLGRHLSMTPPMNSSTDLRGVSMTYGIARILAGGDKTLPVPSPDDFGFQWVLKENPELLESLRSAYNAQENELKAVFNDTVHTISLLEAIQFGAYTTSGTRQYLEDDLGRTMKATAALMHANVGIEAIHIDVPDWDTHEGQGTVDGDLAARMTTLAGNLAALYDDLLAKGITRWTLVVHSEFGRTAAENNSGGTDHGTGGAMFVMGPSVNGGQVYGTWPGLGPDQLFENQDLVVTTDYRSVLCEIVTRRLLNPNIGALFPGFSPTYLNILSA